MNSTAIMLVVISTFMHAAWNLLARHKGNPEVFIWRLLYSIALLGAVPALFALSLRNCITDTAALCLLGSGASCGLYFVCLARGYENGDFTTVYPAARAIPVLLVGIGDVFRGRFPTPLGWLGMFLVALGCLMTPLTSFTDIRIRHYWRPASLWVFLAAVGTTSYTLLDKIGTEAIQPGPLESAVYGYLFFAIAASVYIPLRRVVGKRSTITTDVGWRIPALAGTLSFLAYWLVLWACQMTERASYVLAFRQFSIVIGVVVAVFAFKEAGKVVRLTGCITITCGLILLKLFGS